MGGQNVLRGKVRAVEAGEALLDGADGARFRVPLRGASAQVGRDAYFAVRRDLIELRRDTAGEPPENTLRNVVETVEYQGIYFKVTLSPAGGEEFIAVESEARFFAEPVAYGEKVLASWTTEGARLLEPDIDTLGGTQPYADDSAA
jgi:putative spermidine/putrescine transport system ATP-binding protein